MDKNGLLQSILQKKHLLRLMNCVVGFCFSVERAVRQVLDEGLKTVDEKKAQMDFEFCPKRPYNLKIEISLRLRDKLDKTSSAF